MTTRVSQLSVSEFALRAVARAGKGDWLVLVVPETQVSQIASRVASEVSSLGDYSVEDIRNPKNVVELANVIHSFNRGKVIIISGIDTFSDEAWRHADLLRSRLIYEGAIVLIMSTASVQNLACNAPNLVSWMGGSIWEVDLASEYLSADEKDARLHVLHDWSGLTDAEVLRRAEEGTLPNARIFRVVDPAG